MIAGYPGVAQDKRPSVLLAAVGDVMPARTVTARLREHGTAWAWEGIAADLKRADLRLCNLETAACTGGTAVPKRYSFRVTPTLAKDVLTAGHFSIISLANNHTYDYGRTGLAQTASAMDEAGFTTAGIGTRRSGAIAPRYVTCHGLRIAFVAYVYWTPEGYLPSEQGACLATLDPRTFAREISLAKRHADVLIVSVHWGIEYQTMPTPEQRRLAKAAIDAGADVIIGHHPHVAQPVEVYHGHPICYSLGNCLFDRSGDKVSNGSLIFIRLSRGCAVVEQQKPLRIVDARPMPASATRFGTR